MCVFFSSVVGFVCFYSSVFWMLRFFLKRSDRKCLLSVLEQQICSKERERKHNSELASTGISFLSGMICLIRMFDVFPYVFVRPNSLHSKSTRQTSLNLEPPEIWRIPPSTTYLLISEPRTAKGFEKETVHA